MLQEKVEYKVNGYTNRWSLIDTMAGYGLLENNTYGDETCYLVVKMDQEAAMQRYKRGDGSIVELPTIQEVVCETYDGLEVALDDKGLLSDEEKGSLDGVIQSCEEMNKRNEKEADGHKVKIDLSEYELMPSRVDGFDIYRKTLRDDNGQIIKGIWAAAKEGVEAFAISYEQARGFEPIDQSPVKALGRKLGELLLPR